MKEQLEITGVERPKIKAIEKAADAYVDARDARMKLTEKECSTRETLIATIKEHASELTPNSEGALVYRYGDDLLVILKPGKDKVKVKHDSTSGEDEDREDED
jgi:hypothetical protein